MSNSEKIRRIALAIIKLWLSEGISEQVIQLASPHSTIVLRDMHAVMLIIQVIHCEMKQSIKSQTIVFQYTE